MAVMSLDRLPLGFRFHPTDEELINHYLKGKIKGIEESSSVIPEIDVCKWEPWDLPGKSFIRSEDPEWFFFCPRDRKYPNGQRSNRATLAGYWKATGKDRKIKTKKPSSVLIGSKKTLVFYSGRAPKGERTNWIMHEYKVECDDMNGLKDTFVLCRLFRKTDGLIVNSSADLIEPSGFSPTESKSAPGNESEDYPFDAPIKEELLDPDWAEGSQTEVGNVEEEFQLDIDEALGQMLDSGSDSPVPSALVHDGYFMDDQEQNASALFLDPSFEALDNKDALKVLAKLNSFNDRLPFDGGYGTGLEDIWWVHGGPGFEDISNSNSEAPAALVDEIFNLQDFPTEESLATETLPSHTETGVTIRKHEPSGRIHQPPHFQGTANRRIFLQSNIQIAPQNQTGGEVEAARHVLSRQVDIVDYVNSEKVIEPLKKGARRFKRQNHAVVVQKTPPENAASEIADSEPHEQYNNVCVTSKLRQVQITPKENHQKAMPSIPPTTVSYTHANIKITESWKNDMMMQFNRVFGINSPAGIFHILAIAVVFLIFSIAWRYTAYLPVI